jgi:hypothetical protein
MEGNYVNSWRFECQYRNKASTEVFSKLFRNGFMTAVVAGIVRCEVLRKGYNMDWFQEVPVLPVRVPVNGTADADKTMRWLEKQVKPAIARISDRYDATTFLNVLGLDAIATPKV